MTTNFEQTQQFLEEARAQVAARRTSLLPTQHPNVRLQLNGINLTPARPQYLREFTYTAREGTFEIDALISDPYEIEGSPVIENRIEDQIFLGGSSDVKLMTFQFGYFSSAGSFDTSPTREVLLTKVQPTFTGSGVELRLIGQAAAVEGMFSLSTSATDNPRGDEDSGPKTTYTGKISDVVTQIAGDLGLEPDVAITDDDENTSQEWYLGTMAVFQFIRTQLQPRARNTNGNAGYQLWVSQGDNQNKNLKGTLHFRPPFVDAAATRVFVTGIQNTGDVVEFTFDVNESVGAIGNHMQVRSVDATTKEYVSTEMSLDTQDNLTLTGSKAHVKQPRPTAVLPSNFPTTEDSSRFARAMWEQLFNLTQTASMTIKGDPTTVNLDIGQNVKVLNTLPGGRVHYSSGIWRIQEAVHSVVGSYQVALQLRRSTSFLLGDNAVTDQGQVVSA